MSEPTLNPVDNEEARERNPYMDEELYGRHVEVESLVDLTHQRGTSIPALFNSFYKFIQNPSVISVETFKRMVDTDDTIGSGIEFLVSSLAARLGQYQHPNEEIAKYVNQTLSKIDGGWISAVKSMLSGTWAGFSVSEIQWANTEEGFVPRKLVTLPPQTILFEVERTGSITKNGILQYQRNFSPMSLANGIGLFGSSQFGYGFTHTGQPDPFAKYGDLPYPIRAPNSFSYLSVRIPKQKCIVYSFDGPGKFGNPYGRSLLRRAYKYYVMKDQFLQMLATALDRKGTPLTLVWADPNAPLKDPTKASSVPGEDRGRRGISVSPVAAAQEAFRNIHNDSVIVLPGKKGQVFDVEALSQQSNSSDFIAAIDLCNKSIIRALLIPSLIFSNGDGTGSFSLGQEHAETWEKILDSLLNNFESVLLKELIHPILAYNFEEKHWKEDGMGSFFKRDLTQDERSKEADILDKGITMGAIDMNDLNDLNTVRSKIGMEPRDSLIERVNPLTGMPQETDAEGNPLPFEQPDEEEGEPGEKKSADKKPEPKEKKGDE